MADEDKGGVSKETCKAIKEGLAKQIEVNKDKINKVEETTEKRLDAHSDDIKDLTRVSTEVAATQQQIATLLEMQDKRLKTLEEAVINRKHWYETDIGKWCIKAAVSTAILVLAAAIGRPFLEALAQVKDVVPK